MKEITFFICSMSIGGAEHQLKDLARMLVDKKYKISIVTFSDVEDHYELDKRICRIRLAPHKSRIIKFWSITKFMIFNHCDKLVTFGNRESKLALLGMFLNPFKKYIVGERNFTIGKETCLQKFINALIFFRAQYIVPNSKSQAEYIKSHYRGVKGKVYPIHNYTDLTHYSQMESPHNEVIKIGIFARFTEQKNCNRFVNVVKKLKEKGLSFEIEWFGNKYIKGIDNPEYLEMKRLVEVQQLQSFLHLKDLVKDVISEMSRFDAIALPSLYEGFSNSISEAICCGKPMLVSDVSDNSVMVKNGINGFLFDPLDEDAMVAAFEQFLKLDSLERKKMENESRRIAEDLFDAECFVSKYMRLF